VEINEGNFDCIIKKVVNQSNEMFFQELSIHEVFKGIKYFAKLICYSENPNMIVLKYYRYGSLFEYLFEGKVPSPALKYSFEIAIHLGKRLSYAFKVMHSKGLIHNDIKLANVLLEEDKEEILFPVICDFGSVQVLTSAQVIKGFHLIDVKSGTFQYCAPEVLKCFNKSERISNYKTDVFSLGILLLEIFTKKPAWKEYKMEFALNGGLPDVSLRKFLENFPDIKKEISTQLLRLVLKCLDIEPDVRPMMIDIYDTLANIQIQNSHSRAKLSVENLKS
jgi:serine/threonine protein kinase